MTARYKLTFLTKEWRVVNRKEHAHRWLIDSNRWQCFRSRRIGNSFSDFKAFNTNQGTDITRAYALNLRTT